MSHMLPQSDPKAAFSKARKKLHHQASSELGRSLLSFFYEHCLCRTGKEFRILAIDGSAAKVDDLAKSRQMTPFENSR